MNPSPNASPAGGQNESLADVVKHALDCDVCLARLMSALLEPLITGEAS